MDFYFSPQEAVEFGLAHKIYSPLPLPVAPVATPTTPTGPKPDEVLFQDFLRAFGNLEVRNRPEFSASLQGWFPSSVRETP